MARHGHGVDDGAGLDLHATVFARALGRRPRVRLEDRDLLGARAGLGSARVSARKRFDPPSSGSPGCPDRARARSRRGSPGSCGGAGCGSRSSTATRSATFSRRRASARPSATRTSSASATWPASSSRTASSSSRRSCRRTASRATSSAACARISSRSMSRRRSRNASGATSRACTRRPGAANCATSPASTIRTSRRVRPDLVLDTTPMQRRGGGRDA